MRGHGGKREVARLAWPLAVGMLSFTLMGVTDTLLVGHVSTAAQAGVGLAAILTFTFMAFFRGVITGAQSLVAAADGAGDRARVRGAASAALVLGVVAGLVAAIGLALVSAFVLDWLVADPAIAASARRYLTWRVFGVPLDLIGFALMSALQGLGETRTRMWASLAGNALNIVLDLVLIFGVGAIPAMGEAGAGLATAVGAAAMLAIFAWRFGQLIGRPRWPAAEVLRSAVAIGLPAGAQGLGGTLAFTVMNLALARAGAAHLAASQIVFNIMSLSFLPGFGLGEAGGVLVGRYLGAGKPRTAARAMRSARTIALWVMSGCGLLFALFGEWLAGFFNPDPAVTALAGQLMLFGAVFQTFDAAVMVHLCALRGAGDTRFTLAATLAAAWGLTVPLTLALGLWAGWGAPGAWLGLTLEIAVLAWVTGRRVGGLRGGRVGRLDLLLGSAR